ncbi:MAG: ATP-binding cassette domain-containing protein [Gammaproteobacteria bacterium]|nr:ATP-binding cassette domain-containing protein [Gammaproteobacteria bacterium]
MTQKPLIRVRDLSRYYHGLCAVDQISFELYRGEVLGFLGPNGAGKSTVMRMLSGNLAPSAGSIQIHDLDLLAEPKQAKRHLGFLPQNPPLYLDMTVDEFLRFCAKLHRISATRLEDALYEVKQRCGLAEVGSRLIGTLSKGYQQRIGIAQAVIHKPAVIVLDEPTVGLDPIQIRDIRQLIKELGREHGVILSTHILPEVQATCSRVQIIHRGQLVFNEQMQRLTDDFPTTHLNVRLGAMADLELIYSMEGVEGVQPKADGRLIIEIDPEHNPASRLASLAVQKGWGVFEISPQRQSLEQVFVGLTCQEQSA